MVKWTPSNANGSFSGDSIPLKSAFAKSINSVAVRLGQEMGIKRIIETAQKMGIQSPLNDEPSLALGSSDVNLLELANAYCTVANNGKHHDPVPVTRIVDRDGKEVYTAPSTEEQVIPYKSAFLMQQLLQGGMREPVEPHRVCGATWAIFVIQSLVERPVQPTITPTPGSWV